MTNEAKPEELAEETSALRERCVKLERLLKTRCRWILCHDIYHTSGAAILDEAQELLNDDGEFLFGRGEG